MHLLSRENNKYLPIKTRKYYFISIALLTLLLVIWMDEVFIKTNPPILTYKYELVKILIHTTIAYLLSKFISNKLNEKGYFEKIKQIYLFLGFFALCNTYIISQYVSRTVSIKLVNYETRNSLKYKLSKTGFTGTGFEGKNLTIFEYGEINKYTKLPNLPHEAKNIYVFDWHGFQDYRRIVEFTVKPEFKPKHFFQDTSVLNQIELIIDKNDTTKSYRYKWEIGQI